MAQAQSDSSSHAMLKIHGLTPFPVRIVRDYLQHLEHAYVSINAFETLIDSVLDRLEYVHAAIVTLPEEKRATRISEAKKDAVRSGLWKEISSQAAELTFDPRLLLDVNWELTLATVELQSPGFWEFLAKISPAEVIRQYLNDRHERKKDKQYRNAAEEVHLKLKNEILKNQVISDRIEIAKSLGATEADLRPLLNSLILAPLEKLQAVQDMNVISTAEIRTLPSESDTRRTAAA